MKKILYFVMMMFPLQGICQAKTRAISSIDTTVAHIQKLSKKIGESFSIDKTINGKKTKENWKYYNSKGLTLISIDYKIDSIGYAEKYFLENGSLIYAFEEEIFYTPSLAKNDHTDWSGYFYFSKNKLIDHSTSGHGRSELDDWDPQKEILQQLKKRKEELSLLK